MARLTKENGVLIIRNDWHEEDIQDTARDLIDRTLDREELEVVMELIVDGFDANDGISWGTIQAAIEQVAEC